MTDNHGHCPKCLADLDGGSIWETGLDLAYAGGTGGTIAQSVEEAERMADDYAALYGATRTKGRWGREIGIYDMERDRTVKWQCPDCKHEWPR